MCWNGVIIKLINFSCLIFFYMIKNNNLVEDIGLGDICRDLLI